MIVGTDYSRKKCSSLFRELVTDVHVRSLVRPISPPPMEIYITLKKTWCQFLGGHPCFLFWTEAIACSLWPPLVFVFHQVTKPQLSFSLNLIYDGVFCLHNFLIKSFLTWSSLDIRHLWRQNSVSKASSLSDCCLFNSHVSALIDEGDLNTVMYYYFSLFVFILKANLVA